MHKNRLEDLLADMNRQPRRAMAVVYVTELFN